MFGFKIVREDEYQRLVAEVNRRAVTMAKQKVEIDKANLDGNRIADLLRDKRNELSAVVTERDMAIIDRAELQDLVAKLEGERDAALADSNNATELLRDKRHELDSCRAQFRELSERAGEMEGDLADTREQLRALKVETKLYPGEIRSLGDDLAALEKDKAMLEASLDDARDLLGDARVKRDETIKTLNTQKTAFDELSASAANLRAERDAARVSASSLQQQLDEAFDAVKQAWAERDSARANLAKAEAKVTAFAVKLEKAQPRKSPAKPRKAGK